MATLTGGFNRGNLCADVDFLQRARPEDNKYNENNDGQRIKMLLW